MNDSLFFRIYLSVLILFLLGGIGLFMISKKSETTKHLKLKYWVYLFIVCLHLLLLQFCILGFRILSVITLIFGFYEILKLFPVLKNSGKLSVLLCSILCFAMVCWLYFRFVMLNCNVILFVYLLVVTFDGFAQLFGVIFGKTRMLNRISPGKTWEGLAGGLTGSFLVTFLFRNDFNPIWDSLFLSWLLVVVFAFLGDIFASLLKRKAEIKDFSRIIPGHGGILDRFDSLFLAGSAVYLSTLIF